MTLTAAREGCEISAISLSISDIETTQHKGLPHLVQSSLDLLYLLLCLGTVHVSLGCAQQIDNHDQTRDRDCDISFSLSSAGIDRP